MSGGNPLGGGFKPGRSLALLRQGAHREGAGLLTWLKKGARERPRRNKFRTRSRATGAREAGPGGGRGSSPPRRGGHCVGGREGRKEQARIFRTTWPLGEVVSQERGGAGRGVGRLMRDSQGWWDRAKERAARIQALDQEIVEGETPSPKQRPFVEIKNPPLTVRLQF